MTDKEKFKEAHRLKQISTKDYEFLIGRLKTIEKITYKKGTKLKK